MSIRAKTTKTIIALLLTAVVISAFVLPTSALGEKVYAGGNAFGIKFFTKGVLVAGITAVETASGLVSPAGDAGIKAGDIITSVNGSDVISADGFLRLIADNGNKNLTLGVSRGDESFETKITPATDLDSGIARLGMYVRDSVAGIGTVTYVLADGTFAGLGHGIYDSETGTLLPLSNGKIVDVEITGVVKGKRNMPGELQGVFGSVQKGTLFANTETGVYGGYYRFPSGLGQAMTTSHAEVGKAQIMTTLGSDGVQSYEIEIQELDSSSNTKNLVLHVTDKKLIERAGGIVQGMSGSPIIQNGKLVGAVTHVLVGDPTRGYGIFIENMLNAAE